MTASAPARTLTATGARALTDQLAATLADLADLLQQAWTGAAHTALGYPSWSAYCAAELTAGRRIRLPRPERANLVAALDGAGMPKRAIAAALGIADQTVRADLGATRPPAPLAAAVEAAVPKTAQAALLLAARGQVGMTVHELCSATGWHHGSASRVLHDLVRQHRAIRPGALRAGCGVHLHPGARP